MAHRVIPIRLRGWLRAKLVWTKMLHWRTSFTRGINRSPHLERAIYFNGQRIARAGLANTPSASATVAVKPPLLLRASRASEIAFRRTRLIRPLLAAKVHCGVARIVRRRLFPILRLKTLGARPRSQQRAVDREMLV